MTRESWSPAPDTDRPRPRYDITDETGAREVISRPYTTASKTALVGVQRVGEPPITVSGGLSPVCLPDTLDPRGP